MNGNSSRCFVFDIGIWGLDVCSVSDIDATEIGRFQLVNGV